MGALDGNNSLKHFVREGQHDSLMFDSGYFLSAEYVDTFKNEVKRRAQGPSDSEVSELLNIWHVSYSTCGRLKLKMNQMIMLGKQLVQITGEQLMLTTPREHIIPFEKLVYSSPSVDMDLYGQL